MIEPLEGRVLLSGSPLPVVEEAAGVGETILSAPAQHAASEETLAASIDIGTPALPQVFLDTTYTPNVGGQTINVAAGGNLQTAINNAQPGDTILLQAGATFTGNFSLPNKTGAGWVIIRTAAPDTSLPAPGTRITPDSLGVMARIVSPNSSPALTTQNGAHHYRFIGIEFTVGPAVTQNFGIVNLGSGSQTTAQTPNNLIFDRVIIRGTPTAQIQNGMRMNSASTAVIDSWFDHNQSTLWESHNIGSYNGPGPFKLVNNYFNASTIPVIFGGATPSVSGLIPSDIEIRGNHFTRPVSWRPGQPGYGGTAWYVKNLFEIKNGRRVLFEGNVLEHNWPHNPTQTPDGAPQHGWAILLTVRAEGGSVSWATVSDVTIVNNIIRKSNAGVSLSGTEGQGTHRIKFENNLFDDIGLNWGNNDRSGMLMQVNRIGDLIVDHNTIINDGDIMFVNSSSQFGKLVFNNNIVNHNAARSINWNVGINGTGTGVGNPTLTGKFTEHDATKNVMANASGFTTRYPAGNFFPSTFAQVQFVDFAGRNYRLAQSSPYRNAGTDGKDIGADMDAIDAATAGAISGVWPVGVGVETSGFDRQVAPHAAVLAFDSDVGASLTQDNFTIENLTTGSVVPQGNWSLSYLSASDEAVLTFDGFANGVVQDGVYRVTVHAEGIVNSTGGGMAADYVFEFFYLAGDANGDGVVSIADLGILAANWQQALYGPEHGDFNYDGVVNIADLGILAANWQSELDLSLMSMMQADPSFAGEAEEMSVVGVHEVMATPVAEETVIVAPGDPARGNGNGQGAQRRAAVATAWRAEPAAALTGSKVKPMPPGMALVDVWDDEGDDED